RLISGTEETVSPMTRAQIDGFYRERYVPPAIVVAAAGGLDHDDVVAHVTAALAGSRLAGGPAAGPAAHRPAAPFVPVLPARTAVEHRDTEQAHIVLGGAGLGRLDDRRFVLGVLNNVLGGGMSSRLFQEIREKRGLAYSVYSYTSQYADSGLFGVYAGCAPGKVDEVLALLRAQLAEVAARGVTDTEVARGRGMLKGSLVLGLEDTGSRMSRLAKGELLYADVRSADDLLAGVDAVTVEQVNTLAAELLVQPMSLAVVGPVDAAAVGGA
ncbi:MAG TPA: pitrilysin family protein, partial [Pilimelia sp.]|nr:pitrilysin family protein [Pilimelia sp.]